MSKSNRYNRINFLTKAEIAEVKKLDYDKFVRCIYRTELEKYDDPNWQSKYLANRFQNRFGENAIKLYSLYLITFPETKNLEIQTKSTYKNSIKKSKLMQNKAI